MRIGTLFSGIGAPEQGAKRVYGDDLKMVFACEWDKFARQSFKAIYDIEDEHFHKDINDMDGKQYAEQVDIIIGGSPCQDFSIAGLREGVEGKRGSLIWQYFRIIDEVRPPVFIYENVKGMLSDRNGKTIHEFLEVFRSIGYYCHWDVLNTKDYGVPQNRERVFIVGFLDHEAYYRFQFAPEMPLTKRLKDVLESEVEERYYLKDARFAMDTDGIGRTLRIGGKSSDSEKHCFDLIKEPKILDDQGRKRKQDNPVLHDHCPTLRAQTHGNEPKVVWTEPKIVAMRGRYNESGKTQQQLEEREDGLTNTITCVQKDNLAVDPDYRIRKLTPLECWRLQDFPDEAHEKAKAAGVSDSQRYKQAGNSITVAVIEMIFRQIEKTKQKDEGSLF